MNPKFYGGLSNSIVYKNWNFDFLFHFVKQKAANELLFFPTSGGFYNQPVAVLNHYPESNDRQSVQEYTTGNNPDVITAQNYYTQSDAIISDASFIRLKSVALSYKLPTSWSKGLDAKVYVQGQNLLTLTKYSGPDPETRSLIYLPTLKQFTLGIQIGF